MSARPGSVSYQGHYAGSVSRFAAYAIGLAVSSAAFSLALAAVSHGVHIVTGHTVSWNRSNLVVAIGFAVWQFVYFGYSWAVSGRTFGMALLGILVQREHRALHDLIAGTAVVYAWDARAARLRWLARQAETARPGTRTAAPGRSAS